MEPSQYPETLLGRPEETLLMEGELRRAMQEMLGIPLGVIDEHFKEMLTDYATRPSFRLSPGARLLQGVVLRESPVGALDYQQIRFRSLCVFISALEWAGREVFEEKPDADAPRNRDHRTQRFGKISDRSTPAKDLSAPRPERDN